MPEPRSSAFRLTRDATLPLPALPKTLLGRRRARRTDDRTTPDRPGPEATAVLDAIPDPVSIASAIRDPDGAISDFRITFLNLAAIDFLGLSRRKGVGSTLLATLPAMGQTGLIEVFRNVVETGGAFEARASRYVDQVPGGAPIDGAFDVRIAAHGDGYVSVWRDVTDREATIAELTRTSELVRAIVDSSPFATMALDLEGRLIFWNAGAERMFGWRAEEVIGGPMPREAVFDEDFAAAEARCRQMINDGAPVNGERVRRRTRDGRELIAEIHGGPLRDRDGTLIGFAGQMVDVTRLLEIEDDLALVGRVNAVLGGAVHNLSAGASLELAARFVCDELRALPAVDCTAVGAFVDDGVVLLAASATDDLPVRTGDRLPGHRAESLKMRAVNGPWAQYWTSEAEDGPWGRELDAAGLRAVAVAPIVHDAHVDGALILGTRDEAFARTLVEKWSSIVDLTTAPSALLAERLHARREELALRRCLGEVLDTSAFAIVFQPIVDLASGEVVGHEALTRFESGRRPDLVFGDAWRVGLGAALELATLRRAIDDAKRLPAGRWLDLNISPRLLEDAASLRKVLRTADRPIILEVTEHEVVDDYDAFVRAVRTLGHDIRLAVDDAGAGVANFGHIIDLGPDFVKLDVSLVRRVNAHLGRQALIVGMRWFSRTSGCRLVAEGIETGDEARTLAELGVEFGQGHWFGHPEPAPAR